MSTTKLPKRIRSMSDLQVEKYRLKAIVARDERNVEHHWEKFRNSFTFSNLTELLLEHLFPGNFSHTSSWFSRFSGLWSGIFSVLADRFINRPHRRKH